MGIFEFTRPDKYNKVSEEWQIFESIFPDTGAFKYLPDRKNVYLDDNTYRILRIEKNTEDGSMPESDFFKILRKITVEPVYNKRHIYNYRCGNESFWIKLSMIEKEGQWIGFIKDMTSMMQEINFSESFSVLNSVTKLKNREAFLEELRILAETKRIDYGCLATFHINGINQMNKILGIDNSKKCISCVSRTISHFASEDIIVGSTPYYEFLVYFNNKTEEQSIELITQIAEAVRSAKVTDDFGEALIPGSDSSLSLNCGYCLYPEDSMDFNKLVNYSGFALYEVLENVTGMIKKFDPNAYEKEREFYTDAQIFCKIVDDNLFEYHMQPIVNASSGTVYGYEALMRTTGNKYLNPFQMLEIAKKQKRTYDIERKTFFNVMKILSDNADVFRDKKLFINSIPDHMLNDADFAELYHVYGGLMDKVVIEITEQADLTDNFLDTLNRRREKTGLEIAFDDYGTGYSNNVNLIRYNPEYIKIDRSLITNIDKDIKKKQLFRGIISFAKENGIKTLAEGIETSAELMCVIDLGVDLIQGYYTSRPKPFILYEISKEVKDEIVNVNALKNHTPHPFYVTENMSLINLDRIDGAMYSEILVRRNNVTIEGGSGVFKTGIVIDSGVECTMTLRDIHIKSRREHPVIQLKEDASLKLCLEGKNVFEGSGILVPESAALIIKGEGDLKIVSDEDHPCCIGNAFGEYGSICVDITGSLTLNINGINTVAIGGESNPSRNKIKLTSGNISICNTGKYCVSVGDVEGNAVIEIGKDCCLDIENSSIDNISVGSMKGSVSVISNGNIKIIGSGNNIVGIGVLERGTGIIDIRDGEVSVNFGAKNACCIGTTDGSTVIRVENSEIVLSAGGDNIVGIGDSEGGGTVSLSGNKVSIKLKGDAVRDIGSPMGTVVKNDNEINIKM